MREIILDFPKQFKIGLRAAKNINIKLKPKKICICGMGGSALPANLLAMVLEEYKEKLPLTIQRDYTLPSSVDKQTLIICISYSGNTEETISCAKEALKRKLKIVLISSDGQLERLAKRYSLPFVQVEKGYPPRMALGYLFGALVGILDTLKLIPSSLKKELIELEGKLKPEKLEREGKTLATTLKEKVPIIYASNRLKYLARIWKIKFNENTKIPAFWNYFPELNHNEMVGFTKFKTQSAKHKTQNLDFYFIILKDQKDHLRNKKRMDLTAKILRKQGIKGEIIKLQGETFLEKVFNSILLSDWVSYYLAKTYGVDPIPVKMVEEFKKLMKTSNN